MTTTWEASTIGEACQIVNGGTPKTGVASYWGGEHCWITPAEMGDLPSPYVSETRRTLTDTGLDTCSARLLPPSSVILSSRAPIGHLVINTVPMATNQGCKGLVPSGNLTTKFLYYYLRSIVGLLNDLGTGATFKELSGGKLAQVPIRVPRLPEQKRIVAILDQAFEAIDTAKADAEKNLLNAKELADGSLATVFNKQDSKWETVSLQVLLDRGWIESHLDGNHGSEYPRKEEFVSTGVPYVSANCLHRDEVDMSRAKYLSKSHASRIRKGIAKNDDVLFAHNATVGPVAILRTTEPNVILGTSLTYYRCNPRHILPDYLALYMRSSLFSKQYKQVMRQSTRNQVPITKQREFVHVVPPIREQQAVVEAVERMSGASRQLEVVNSRRCQLLEELGSSLLASAFTAAL